MGRFGKFGARMFAAIAVTSGVLTGCGSSENFVFTNGPSGVPAVQAPVANDDTATALGNATLRQAVVNGVLTNDVVNGATITDFDATSAQGATVELNEDGSFEYTPVFGFTGSDTFDYTLSNASGESTATVAVSVDGRGLFVNNSRTENGNGSQASPFNNLADAIAGAASGDTIFVYAGDGAATNQTGSFVLPQGVDLVGQAQGLVVAQTIEPVGSRPVINGTIVAQGDNVIAGLTLTNTIGDPAISAEDVSNLTIENNVITGLTDDNISLESIGNRLEITGNRFVEVGGSDDAINLDQVDTDAVITISGNTFTQIAGEDPDEAIDIDVEGTSVVTLAVTDNVMTGDLIVGNGASEAFDMGLYLETTGSSDVTLTFTGNTLTNAIDDQAIMVRCMGSKGVDATISGNTIDGSDDDGIDYEWTDNVVDTFVVRIENNTLSNIESKDIDIDGYSNAVSKGLFFVRRNTTSSDNSASFQFNIGGSATACLDIFGNSFADDLSLSSGGGSFDVERLNPEDGGPLDAEGLNSVGGILELYGLLTSRPPGFTQTQVP